jgi:uncharacterized protein
MARYDFSVIQDTELTAASGGAEALFNLGMMYSTGRIIEEDLVKAHQWFNLAAMQGNQAAREYRIDIAQEMSQQDIETAQRKAREWLSDN